MNSKRSKIIIFISLSFMLICLACVSVFAYLNATSNKTATAKTSINTENVIEIASFEDLFMNSQASAYNDSNIVSDAQARKILRLTSNIELESSIEVTSDVHLDLNGKTLNLNNNTLTFRHGYSGSFGIYGGIINTGSNSLGKIVVDLANASFETSNMTYYNNTTVTQEENCVTVLKINPKFTAYNALYNVSDSIASDLSKKVSKATYQDVNESSYTIDQSKFITTKTNCIFNSNTDELCSFVYKDLDLPMHYLSTDVEITYSSSNENIISNYGKVTLPTTTEDVTLTATVNHPSWDNPYSCAFKLHVCNLGVSSVKNNVSKQLILDYLNDYYKEETLNINESVSITNYYEFVNSVELPLTAFDNNITYLYHMTDLDNETVNTTSFEDNNVFVLQPNDNCYHLVVELNNSTSLVLNMYSKYVSDYETIARLILNKLYGGSIVYDSSTGGPKTLFKVSDFSANLDQQTYNFISNYNITNLTYSLKEGPNEGSKAPDYYTYSDYVLTASDSNVPPSKTSYITATFTFGSGDDAVTVDVDMYVDYLAESGDTVAGFLPYYNRYDPMVQEDLEYEFEMPFSFGNGAPYICYDFAKVFETHKNTSYEEKFNYYTYTLGRPLSLDVILYYNGQERYTFTNTTTSLTTLLDTYLTNNGLTVKRIAEYGDAKYIFRINAQNSTIDDVPMLLLYNYKFNPASSWTTYKYSIDGNSYVTELTSSKFNICGGLFYNQSSTNDNAVHDRYFFQWIYNNFNPNGLTINASNVNTTSFIPKKWLSIDVELDVTKDSSLSSVSDYYGIGNLSSITKVNLSGVTLSTSTLGSISKLSSVTSLNLSGCGITDITNICKINSVKILNLSNNSIGNFNGLVDLDNLEEVYVYGNKDDVSNRNTQDGSYVDGSFGIINFQTYNDLIRNGITVFNRISNGVPVIFEDSDNYDDYAKLKSIVYQNKLPEEISIEELYKNYKNMSATAYGLINTDGEFTWGYQTTDKDGNTYTEYTATYFYCNYAFGNYTLTVKYYVDRY